MRSGRIAWRGAAVSLALVAVALIAFPGSAELRNILIAVPFALIGGLLGARRPGNPIGWLFLAFGVAAAVNLLTERYADHGFADPGSLPGTEIAASIAAHLWHPGFAFLVFAFLLFPDGHLVSPRWRWVARAAVVVYGGLAISGPFDVDQLRSDFPRAEGLAHGGLAHAGSSVFGLLLAVNLLLLAAAGASLVVRLRRSSGVERLQVKAFVLPVAITMFVFPLSVVLVGDGRYGVWLFPLIPSAAAVAILRFRLYDIDVVINRTLVYGALTGTLAATYLGSVLLLQLVLSPSSGLAVAGSTLAVAALFRPARTRIQAAVDQRFFRSKYDAQRALAAFADRLRAEVSVDAIRDDLCGAVDETMHPAHVSLWIRNAP
jgi:hypothetical protein